MHLTRAIGRICTAFAILASAACTGASGNSSSVETASGPPAQFADLQIVEALPPPPNTNLGADELIAKNDLLEIDFFQVDKLDRTTRVDSNGNISLSLIGRLEAAGLKIPELETEIEQRYGAKYLQNPDVTVFMKESAGNRVTIDGQVRKPGIYPVSSTSSLLEIIALAGGFSEIADENKVYVFRTLGDRKLVANHSVKQIRAGKRRDPKIYGGDVIVSFSSSSKVAASNLREALGIASRAASLATPF
jgi:polysaccharide export outer membrane protein